MTWIDIVLIIIMASLVIHGIIFGLIRGVFEILGIFIGCFLAINFNDALGIPKFLGFLLIFVVVVIGFSFLGRVIKKIIHLTPLGFIDRILGGLLGLLKGIVVCFVFLIICLLLKTPNRTLHVSKIAPSVLRYGLEVSRVLPEKWYNWIEEVITKRQLVFDDEDHHIYL